MVMRLPYIMRVSMSRPIWSAPNIILTEGSSQVPPTLADSAYGASQGVNKEIAINSDTTTAPKAAEAVSR